MKKFYFCSRENSTNDKGFTLVELVLVIASIAVLLTILTPTYKSFLEKTRISRAAADIRTIEKDLTSWFLDNDSYPANLALINRANLKDPWGQAYLYAVAVPGAVRQDAFGNDLNSDYDLYSLGIDGVSAQDITDPSSLDDVIRTSNGGWVGKAQNY
ncbi:MAG: hypothetical protein Tsb0017_14820 [Geothermobacteraceae bacterium]